MLESGIKITECTNGIDLVLLLLNQSVLNNSLESIEFIDDNYVIEQKRILQTFALPILLVLRILNQICLGPDCKRGGNNRIDRVKELCIGHQNNPVRI